MRFLAEQRHVRQDVQVSSEALPGIRSVRSVLSVVKNTIAFLPRITLNTRMNPLERTVVSVLPHRARRKT